MTSPGSRPSVADFIDPAKPSVARAYSYLLGGKDYYEVDRQLMDRMRDLFTDPESIAITNRQWLIRAVRWLVERAGVKQFIDCGSGLPTDENVHEIAQKHDPDSVVLYSDNDPTVQAYGRALLEENENTLFLGADLTQPERILDHPLVRERIDFDEPVALIQCATLHHVPDEPRRVKDVLATYLDALPSGSYLALTHVIYPPAADDPDGRFRRLAGEVKIRIQKAGMNSGFWREYDEVLSFFDGMELMSPGLVHAAKWWPTGPMPMSEVDHLIYGGVARKR